MKRVYADLFDIVVSFIVLMLIFIGYKNNQSSFIIQFKIYIIIGSVLSYIWWYYAVIPQKNKGQTWGKKIFKVQIYYKKPTMLNYFGREFFATYILTSMTLGLYYVINLFLFKYKNIPFLGDIWFNCSYQKISKNKYRNKINKRGKKNGI